MRRSTNRWTLAGFMALAALGGAATFDPGSATAEAELGSNDAVMDWNQIALAATTTGGLGPVPQMRAMAIVQVSMHDAVNGITGSHATYLPVGSPPSGASADAAAVAAAHYALVHLFTLSTTVAALDLARAASLAALGLDETDAGIGWGEGVAAAVLADRADDGASSAIFPYTAPGAGSPGVWVPAGPAPALLPGWGAVSPWVLRSGSQFRPDAPPALDSGRYARDYNEIKAIGSLTSSTRTAAQTETARFWLGQPATIWNPLARQAIEAHGLNLSDSARVLALLHVAGSDAAIACWDAKYVFNFWRPMNAIRNGDQDDNDATVRDAAWTPLFPTPPHPEYISGHSTASSAMATVLALTFGDDPGVSLAATSPTNLAHPRTWETFSEGVDEVIEARIYSGIHFRTADEVGARVGRQVARFVVNHTMR